MTRRELLTAAGGALLAQAPLRAGKSRISKANISALTDEIGRTQAEAIEFAHRYGLECVELRNVPETKKEFSFLSEPELKKWASELASNKLKVTFLNTSLFKFTWPGLGPGKMATPAEQARWDRRKEDVSSALLAANILGVDKIRVFTGTRIEHPESVYPLIVKTMEEIIPLAQKAKVKLLIENENSQNIGTSPEVKEIMALLPSSSIGYNWDPGNSQSLNETAWPNGYSALPKNRMLNAQFKAKNLLEGPEKIDWKAILEAMQRDGFKGHIGLETHGASATLIERANESMKIILRMVGELS